MRPWMVVFNISDEIDGTAMFTNKEDLMASIRETWGDTPRWTMHDGGDHVRVYVDGELVLHAFPGNEFLTRPVKFV